MTRAIMVLVVLALAWPAATQAQTPQTKAPAGNSAVDEYLETAPGASGNTRPRRPGQQGAGALAPAARARLERLGPDGRALASAVDATSPGTRQGSTGELRAPSGDGRAPAREVLGAVDGDDGGSGMGLLLPAILIAVLLAAIALALLRRRAASRAVD
ncbi:MAG: hypothetical protein WKF48_11045 [Solirubrobacteraceae bacterium]